MENSPNAVIRVRKVRANAALLIPNVAAVNGNAVLTELTTPLLMKFDRGHIHHCARVDQNCSVIRKLYCQGSVDLVAR